LSVIGAQNRGTFHSTRQALSLESAKVQPTSFRAPTSVEVGSRCSGNAPDTQGAARPEAPRAAGPQGHRRRPELPGPPDARRQPRAQPRHQGAARAALAPPRKPGDDNDHRREADRDAPTAPLHVRTPPIASRTPCPMRRSSARSSCAQPRAVSSHRDRVQHDEDTRPQAEAPADRPGSMPTIVRLGQLIRPGSTAALTAARTPGSKLVAEVATWRNLVSLQGQVASHLSTRFSW